MKGSSLFRRRAKTVTTVSIMLLPDHLLLAIAGHSTELVRQHIPLGESWPQVLAPRQKITPQQSSRRAGQQPISATVNRAP
jgi:hypothetical protein